MSSHFLLYRNDVTIFDLPVQSGPTFGNIAQLGKWDTGWTHVRPFGLSGQPFYRTSGEAFTAPIHLSGTDLTPLDQRSPAIGNTAIVSNLGSSDVNQQFAQAVQITKKTVDDLVPVVAVIVGSILGGAVGPIGGFEKGKEITDAFDWAVQGLSDLADSFGLHIGPGNCNGVVLSASWIYSSSDFPAAVGVSGSERVDGPAKSGCGTAPSTNLSWSVRPA
jgi:hypothetical protein